MLHYQTMGAKDKKRFEDMAERDKQRFDKEMANYTPPAGQKKKKKKKDPNAPKRSLLVSFYDLIANLLCPVKCIKLYKYFIYLDQRFSSSAKKSAQVLNPSFPAGPWVR